MTKPFIELTDQQLSGVSGGFLPLLGLIGPISGIVGQVLGGIGKKKSQDAEKISQDAQGQGGQSQGQGQGQGQGQQAPGRQLTGGMMGERAPVQSQGG